MEIKEMNSEQVEARLAEIRSLIDTEDADIEALTSEVDALIDRRDSIKKSAAEKRALLDKVANSDIKPITEIKEGETKIMNAELRNNIYDALAETIKGKATPEQRALLTTDASGVVAVNEIIDEYVWTDWDKSSILSRIRKVYIQGNYKVGYEASATGAVLHPEGSEEAPAEETLTIAYIDFVAQYFKKWITVSDRVMALKGQAFLDYLYDEFGHQLAKALEDAVVAELESSSLTAKVTNPLDSTATVAGLAAISDEATNPVIITNKTIWANIMKARTTAGAKIEDPFEGLEVLFNRTATGLIVVDLDGVVANFPEGESFKYIVDETSLAENDLVKIVGKILVAVHLVRPHGAALVKAA